MTVLLDNFCSFSHNSWWQVDLESIRDLEALCFADNEVLCQLLSVSLIATVVLVLDMQVKGPLRGVGLLTALIRACMVSFELSNCFSIVNFSLSGPVPECLHLSYVFIIIFLYSIDLVNHVISFICHLLNLLKQILVLDEQIVELTVVLEVRVILRHLEVLLFNHVVFRLNLNVFKLLLFLDA